MFKSVFRNIQHFQCSLFVYLKVYVPDFRHNAMEKHIAFAVLSIILVFLSRKTLFRLKSHGFYRFLSWECMAWLLANNFLHWFRKPSSINQVFSWVFLFIGLYFVIAGALLLKRKENQQKPELTIRCMYSRKQQN